MKKSSQTGCTKNIHSKFTENSFAKKGLRIITQKSDKPQQLWLWRQLSEASEKTVGGGQDEIGNVQRKQSSSISPVY